MTTALRESRERQVPPPPDRNDVQLLPLVNLHALQAFVLIASGCTFREAGRRLHLESPHVTKLIQGLEATLGTALLHRTSQQIGLTDAGWAALAPAKSMLAAAARMADSVRA